MVDTGEFLAKLTEKGFNFYTGVPCSIFKTLIRKLEQEDFKYIANTREDEALGFCTGAQLAGKKPVMVMQNSGLGNSINILSSLDLLYKIPILMLISWRGETKEDAPEHWVMGESMTKLLDSIGVPYFIFDSLGDVDKATPELEDTGKPVALIFKKGSLE
jgi:phosphonopyruvate decarboxylase